MSPEELRAEARHIERMAMAGGVASLFVRLPRGKQRELAAAIRGISQRADEPRAEAARIEAAREPKPQGLPAR